MTGIFISFEGIDGAGKTTHITRLHEHLLDQGRDVCLTREPGGTALGESIREWVLHRSVATATEVLLMFAARAEHLEQVIRPALAAGKVVLCDRFTDATMAYQGAGRGVDMGFLRLLAEQVEAGTRPSLTVLFDVPPAVSRERLAGLKAPDRFEREQSAFFERVRAGYLALARAEPQRFALLDARQPMEAVTAALLHVVSEHLR
ncbi:MAG: dTMP kinase [Burkholderiales bacterium]|jgi:dTMP kinase